MIKISKDKLGSIIETLVKQEMNLKESRDEGEKKEEAPKTFPQQIAAITNSAAQVHKKIEALGKVKFPTANSQNAFQDVIEGITSLVMDMLENPKSYLDENTDEILQNYSSELDNGLTSYELSPEEENEPEYSYEFNDDDSDDSASDLGDGDEDEDEDEDEEMTLL